MAIQQVKNGLLLGGDRFALRQNSPTQYASKQKQYLDNETAIFAQEYAKYASDYVQARVQGLRESAPRAWDVTTLRLSDILHPSAATGKVSDDFKSVLFDRADIAYLRPGVKIETMGSTWLVVNPENISGASGVGVVQRCNAVWNHYDSDGNILSEPLAVSSLLAKASANDPQISMLIAKDYFNVKCQYNEYTAQLNTNSRLILGSGAYAITGFSDFTQEFTGDYSTVRLLEFTVRYEEPNYEIDDMVNHIAGGLVAPVIEDNTQEAPSDSGGGYTITLESDPPAVLRAYDTVDLKAVVTPAGTPVAWSVNGANIETYTAAENGNTLSLTCWRGSVTPLTVTASCGDASISVNIGLEGL